MTTTAIARLQELADRADLAALVARQARWLDERRFDEAGAIFTEDASVHPQGGHSHGLRALTARAHRNHSTFAATQHVISDVLIDIDDDGDGATVRANLIATFVRDATDPEPATTIGERYRFQAIRTPRDWRFSRLEVTPVWRHGHHAPAEPSSENTH